MFVSVFLREQRQKEATKTAVVNSFPKDRDYRREAMQASAAPGFTAASKYENIRGFIEIYSVDFSSNLAVGEMVETTENEI